MLPSAKIIADSISPAGDRLTTIEIVLHRFCLAELNTHRAFSRNSASSRAIPVHKQLKKVMDDPAIPLVWPAEQSGMQGGEALSELDQQEAEHQWLRARDLAVEQATALMQAGVHKSVTNRLLEPFMAHVCIISATDWGGFWKQRCSPLAQPEIHAVADLMKEAYDASIPQSVQYGEWHLPYIQPDEEFEMEDAKRISVARCARVSYLTHDGVRDPSKDLEMYDRLVTADPAHASPLEHVATPATHFYIKGNFSGWEQLRHRVLGF